MSKLSSELCAVTVVGLDLAKHVFQVHCVDAEGRAVVNRSLRRRELLAFFGVTVTVYLTPDYAHGFGHGASVASRHSRHPAPRHPTRQRAAADVFRGLRDYGDRCENP